MTEIQATVKACSCDQSNVTKVNKIRKFMQRNLKQKLYITLLIFPKECIHSYVYVYACMYIYTHVYMYVYMCVYVCMYVCVCVYVKFICMYTLYMQLCSQYAW